MSTITRGLIVQCNDLNSAIPVILRIEVTRVASCAARVDSSQVPASFKPNSKINIAKQLIDDLLLSAGNRLYVMMQERMWGPYHWDAILLGVIHFLNNSQPPCFPTVYWWDNFNSVKNNLIEWFADGTFCIRRSSASWLAMVGLEQNNITYFCCHQMIFNSNIQLILLHKYFIFLMKLQKVSKVGGTFNTLCYFQFSSVSKCLLWMRNDSKLSLGEQLTT